MQCKTASHDVPFEYRLAPGWIKTRNQDGKYSPSFGDAEINGTLQFLRNEFGERPFPLANNVVEVPAGNEAMGLGTAYWKTTRRSAGYTSRLAVVLESIGVFVRYNDTDTRSKHWTLNLETLGIDSASGQVNIRPYLDDVIQGDSTDIQDDLTEPPALA